MEAEAFDSTLHFYVGNPLVYGNHKAGQMDTWVSFKPGKKCKKKKNCERGTFGFLLAWTECFQFLVHLNICAPKRLLTSANGLTPNRPSLSETCSLSPCECS